MDMRKYRVYYFNVLDVEPFAPQYNRTTDIILPELLPYDTEVEWIYICAMAVKYRAEHEGILRIENISE